MHKAINERIHQPVVQEVFDEWGERGLLEETEAVLSTLPEELGGPVTHAFITHVYKEKGLFLNLVAERYEIDPGPRKTLAASADILWALSLMLDDIEDNDTVRGGLESSWHQFGTELTMQGAYATLESLLKRLYCKTGSEEVARSAALYIQLGLRSLQEHRTMDLDTPVGVLVANYENRCDFHATYQLASMFQVLLQGKYPHDMHEIIKAFRFINQSGQLINDLKDFIGGDLYSRGFSDLRNRVPTVPLVYMRNGLPKAGVVELERLFGKQELTIHDRQRMAEMIESSHVTPNTKRRILDNYSEALLILDGFLEPTQLAWFEKWTQYKEGLI